MRRAYRVSAVLIALIGACGPLEVPPLAQDKPAGKEAPAGWSDKGELSYVVTGGNAETSTVGFKNTLGRAWERSGFELKAGGIRAESTTTTRTAVGPSNTNFSVVEESTTDLTAENYFLNGRYDRKISEHVFWFAGAGWDRNRFAGVENRYAGVGGIGNIWVDSERVKFRTDYSATFTRQNDVVENPDAKEDFAGARLSSKLEVKFGQNGTYGNDTVIDENLDDTSDLRADMTNWVAVSMSTHLALKVSLQLLYDGQPSFAAIPREFPLGTATGETVLVELDDLDTIFTTSLVLNF
jgi:putative salt-induced outer membrane protein YdiY